MERDYTINYFCCNGPWQYESSTTVKCKLVDGSVKAKVTGRYANIVKGPEDIMEKYSSKSVFGAPSKISNFLKKFGIVYSNDDNSSIREAKRRFNEDLGIQYKRELIEFLEARGLKLKMKIDVTGWGEAYGDSTLILESKDEKFEILDVGSETGTSVETLVREGIIL